MLELRRRIARFGGMRTIASLAAFAYLAVALHGVVPGLHGDHAESVHVASSAPESAEVGPSPVCPHRLPDIEFEAHSDCALCKLTRSVIGPDAASGPSVPLYVAPARVVVAPFVPSFLDDWQPVSRRGPPLHS